VQGPIHKTQFIVSSSTLLKHCFAIKRTYTRECNTAITAFGRGGELLEVVVDELAAGGLDHSPPVGGGVVGCALAEGYTLGHVLFKDW
jgi:hypothetical protein